MLGMLPRVDMWKIAIDTLDQQQQLRAASLQVSRVWPGPFWTRTLLCLSKLLQSNKQFKFNFIVNSYIQLCVTKEELSMPSDLFHKHVNNTSHMYIYLYV